MKKKLVVRSLVVLISIFMNTLVFAAVPLNNLEGVGGVAFNPLAYPANPGTSLADFNSSSIWKYIGKPQIGAWYVNLSDVSIDWTTFGVAETFFKRVEVSYGHETIAIAGFDNIYKNNIGTKVLILAEGIVLPAISIGGVWKRTTLDVPDGVDDSGIDYYAVATKLVKALPKPVLLSGGVISTEGRTLGVLGFDEDRDEALFGNIDIIPLENAALGFEYRQGASFDDFKNADYWNAHVAWFVNKNLTLIGAYVNAGDHESSSKVGLGDGVVLSIQYAF
ncbi:MAG: DUF3034 family protein [Sedimentisphaerales bacterium]|nr:DUF3034 family protein [Sedimentisphaerales bacterium]